MKPNDATNSPAKFLISAQTLHNYNVASFAFIYDSIIRLKNYFRRFIFNSPTKELDNTQTQQRSKKQSRKETRTNKRLQQNLFYDPLTNEMLVKSPETCYEGFSAESAHDISPVCE